ncbi:hypothetical protein PG988_013917 [Apiospora saccharicola]
MGKQKKQGSHTVPERGKAHPHHHHHHQQRPEAPAHDGAFNPAPAWSPVMLTESFAYTALQGPNGPILPHGHQHRRMVRTWRHKTSPLPPNNQAPGSAPARPPPRRTVAGILPTPTGGSDTGSGSDDSGSASHSEVRKKKGKVKSSGHRHRHSSRQPSRHRQHRSRSAHRSRAHGHGHHAGKEAQSQHKVHRWLDDDTF